MRLEALQLARATVARRCERWPNVPHFICHILEDTADSQRSLAPACHALMGEIKKDLAPLHSLGGWLADKGLYLTDAQDNQCRLAWLDKLIYDEEHK